MTGSVRRRGDVWEIRVSLGRDPLTGQYRRHTRTIKGTKAEANRALRELVGEVERGRHTGATTTLARLIEDWLEVAGPDMSPTTLDGYRSNIRTHILPALGDTRLRDIETATLDTFYAALRRPPRSLAPSTIRQVHAVIRQALQQALRWGWLPSNPATLATLPSVVTPEVDPPPPADVLRLIDAAATSQPTPTLSVLLRLAAATGARRGELCALRWRHIDLDTGVVRIEQAVIETGPTKTVVQIRPTKTKGIRKVSLDPDTVEVLRAHRAWWEERAKGASWRIGPTSFVFSHSPDASEPLRPSTATQAMRRLRDRLGMPEVHLHSFRHFVATRLMAGGVDVVTVAGRLGHADTATTLRVYSHALEARDRDAGRMMGDLLRPEEE